MQLAVEARGPLKRFVEKISEKDLLLLNHSSVKDTVQSLCKKFHELRFCHIALLFSKLDNSWLLSVIRAAISDLNSIAHFYNVSPFQQLYPVPDTDYHTSTR